MDGTRDHHDRLAFGLKARGFGGRGFPRVGETALDVEIMVEIFDVRGGRDRHSDLWPAFDGLAQFLELDLVARFFKRLEVGNHLAPVEEFVVDADFVAKVALRSRNRGECGRAEQSEPKRGKQSEPKKVRAHTRSLSLATD